MTASGRPHLMSVWYGEKIRGAGHGRALKYSLLEPLSGIDAKPSSANEAAAVASYRLQPVVADSVIGGGIVQNMHCITIANAPARHAFGRPLVGAAIASYNPPKLGGLFAPCGLSPRAP